MDDMFNPELLEGLDEFDDEGDSFRIESPIEIVNKDMSHVEDKKPIAIIGIIIFMVIIVIVSALIFNV